MTVTAASASRSNSSSSFRDDASEAGIDDSSLNASTTDSLSRTLTVTERLALGSTTSEKLARELGGDADQGSVNESVLDGYLDMANEAPSGLTSAGEKLFRMGTETLVDNPQINKVWESTQSAWTGKSGFTNGAREILENAGMVVSATVNPTPAGSVEPGPGISANSVNTYNGNLAEDAIADRYSAQGYTVRQQTVYDADFNRLDERPGETRGHRFVDVEVERPHATDPRLNQLDHIESKAFRVNAGDISASQLAHDSGMLQNNQVLRQTGFALEKVGKVARPVGLLLDTVEVIGSIRKDGGIGVETAKSITGIAGGAAGGWGGAAAGAAIGTAILPGVGTVIGGVLGGIAGAWGGESVAKGAFDTVKSWFS